MPGQDTSCGATLLDAFERPLNTYFYTPTLFTDGQSVSHTLCFRISVRPQKSIRSYILCCDFTVRSSL